MKVFAVGRWNHPKADGKNHRKNSVKRLPSNILLYIFAASIPNEMKKNELTRKLAASGCYICRNGANHEWWYSPLTDSRFPISRHGVNEIPNGTLKSIEKQSGVKLM